MRRGFDLLAHHLMRSFVILCVLFISSLVLDVESVSFESIPSKETLTIGNPHLSTISVVNLRQFAASGVLYPND